MAVPSREPPGPGCGVVRCLGDVDDCCMEAVANAVALDDEGDYFAAPELVQRFEPSADRVVTSFRFERAGDGGNLVFNLGRTRAVESVEVFGSLEGAGAPVGILLWGLAYEGCVALSASPDSSLVHARLDREALPECFEGGNPEASLISVLVDATGAGEATLDIRRVDVSVSAL